MDEIEGRIGAEAEALGLEMIETVRAGGTLRVTIDTPGGVSIDDCARLSRALRPLLDADPAAAGLTLEVSSPGLDRKLRLPRDLRTGARVRVERREKADGRRRHVGRVTAFDDEALVLEQEGSAPVRIAYREISVARLEPTF